MLDVGAGHRSRPRPTLAARGLAVVALDVEAALLEALEQRAAGLPVETVVADAREFDLTPALPARTGADADAAAARRTGRTRSVSAVRAGAPRAGRTAGRGAGRPDGLLRRGPRAAAPARRLRDRRRPLRQPAARAWTTRTVARRSTGAARSSGRASAASRARSSVRLDRVTARARSRRKQLRVGFVGEPTAVRARDRGVPRIDGGNRPRAVRRLRSGRRGIVF